MIKTKPYNLTKRLYTNIVIIKRLKKSWWLYALMFLLTFFHLNKFGKDNFATFLVIFGFTYPIIIVAYLYYWSRSKKHDLLFKTMNVSFDESNLYFKRNGNESKIPAVNIQNVISKKEYWLLYIQQGNFIYVKKDIFYSEGDLDSFKKLLNVNT